MTYYKIASWINILCNMLFCLPFLLYCYHSGHGRVYFNCLNEFVTSINALSNWAYDDELSWQFRRKSLPVVCYEIIDKCFRCDLFLKYHSSYASLRENERFDVSVNYLFEHIRWKHWKVQTFSFISFHWNNLYSSAYISPERQNSHAQMAEFLLIVNWLKWTKMSNCI